MVGDHVVPMAKPNIIIVPITNGHFLPNLKDHQLVMQTLNASLWTHKSEMTPNTMAPNMAPNSMML